MTIKKIDHIAIVVEHLDTALTVYRDALGMTVTDVREMPEQDVKMAFLPTGDSEIELLEPLSADSGIGKYLAKRGEGLHHVCLEVDDIDATLADLKAKGAQLIDEKPRRGAFGRIAFIHPKGAHGVLVELVQRDEK
jgi:methylmalonyl-CoA epimerase